MSDHAPPTADQLSVPSTRYDQERLGHPNIFREVFGALGDDQWLRILKRSIQEPVIEGVRFPRFPDPELQTALHGSTAEQAIEEAFNFYAFIRARLGDQLRLDGGARLLDFGSGWGRMIRPFMRHFDLADIYGYEPTRMFCAVARELNPYVCFLNGEYLPNRRIPPDSFDLMIGYSVFSHLSPQAASLWLREVGQLLRPGSFAVFTTWGEPYLKWLIGEQARGDAGEDLHWHTKLSLSRFGRVAELLARYRSGEFVWVDMGHTPHYGAAFLGPKPLQALIEQERLPLEVIEHEGRSLPQDVFILRRT